MAVTTTGAFASMAAGTPDVLIGPALIVSVFVFSLFSEKTPVIAGTATDDSQGWSEQTNQINGLISWIPSYWIGAPMSSV